jgi:DnaJ-class molecular chaperone
MTGSNEGARVAPLADCPYCDGEGDDQGSALGLCRHCYGTGRVARFLAERTLERWARSDRADRDGSN